MLCSLLFLDWFSFVMFVSFKKFMVMFLPINSSHIEWYLKVFNLESPVSSVVWTCGHYTCGQLERTFLHSNCIYTCHLLVYIGFDIVSFWI